MSVRSAAPSSAPLVYTIISILAVLAALISAAVIGIIVYNYVSRPELRDPAPQEGTAIHGELPSWLLAA